MHKVETAVAIGLWSGGGSEDERTRLDEIYSLADTAGVIVVEEFIQKLNRPDRRYYIGPGKAREIAEYIETHQVSTVIVDGELSPSQVKNLEKLIPAKILDRSELILDIFAQRASSRDGKLQVELAQLRYQLPKLVGRGRDLSRLAGGIGTRGPGESKLETDRRRIRHRITVLERELKQLEKHRGLLRQKRQQTGVFQVALVGYTNSGKSTLLNRLTNAEAFAADILFATLDPLSRRLETERGTVVLSDTVGFISGLPHHLIAAFRATLEVVIHADLLVHLVDVATPQADARIRQVNTVLEELGCLDKNQILAANKIDLLEDLAGLAALFRDGPNFVPISAEKNKNIDLLLQEIVEVMEPHVSFAGNLPLAVFKSLSRRYPGKITPRVFTSSHVEVEALLPQTIAAGLEKYHN